MNSILSQLREAGYDVGLQGEEIALEYVGDGQPDAAVVEPLLAEVAARKGEMICILGASRVEPGVGAGDSERLSELLEKGIEGIAGALRRAIDRARDWDDLNQICVDNQAAFEAKLIDGDTSYHLAGLVLSRSRMLPECGPPDEQVIPAEALLSRSPMKWSA
jgi:hypothetical protein